MDSTALVTKLQADLAVQRSMADAATAKSGF